MENVFHSEKRPLLSGKWKTRMSGDKACMQDQHSSEEEQSGATASKSGGLQWHLTGNSVKKY